MGIEHSGAVIGPALVGAYSYLQFSLRDRRLVATDNLKSESINQERSVQGGSILLNRFNLRRWTSRLATLLGYYTFQHGLMLIKLLIALEASRRIVARNGRGEVNDAAEAALYRHQYAPKSSDIV
jgi:hypothetical protein